MIPYIHIGPLSLGTFGIFLWLGFAAAFVVWRKDLERRDLHADVYAMVAGIALSGVVGAKLYNALQEPAALFEHPIATLFSRMGFAWFGGFLGGIIAIIYFARKYRIPILTLMDSASPAAAVGYAIGRIGCMTSGDGDYGIPTNVPWGVSFPPPALVPSGPVCVDYGFPADCKVHPTPMYELIAGLAIAAILWKLGTDRRRGVIVGWFFVLSGLSRFLVEFIRINPRIYFGMSNAQVAALASIIAGAIVLASAARTGARHSASKNAL
jgi:phosphatidylglycerol---prolipoprotein diacylglyceryl transferase